MKKRRQHCLTSSPPISVMWRRLAQKKSTQKKCGSTVVVDFYNLFHGLQSKKKQTRMRRRRVTYQQQKRKRKRKVAITYCYEVGKKKKATDGGTSKKRRTFTTQLLLQKTLYYQDVVLLVKQKFCCYCHQFVYYYSVRSLYTATITSSQFFLLLCWIRRFMVKLFLSYGYTVVRHSSKQEKRRRYRRGRGKRGKSSSVLLVIKQKRSLFPYCSSVCVAKYVCVVRNAAIAIRDGDGATCVVVPI